MVHYGRSVMMGGVLHNGRFSRLFWQVSKAHGSSISDLNQPTCLY
jgi:hypothetical protein